MIYLFRHAENPDSSLWSWNIGNQTQQPPQQYRVQKQLESCGWTEVIHKHKRTHAPTIQSPSPHMGLKTIRLRPTLPRLLPLRLTAPESALTVLRVWQQNPVNETEPMSAQKGTELEWGEIDSSVRKSAVSRQENGSALLLIFHLVNPYVLPECKVENLRDQSAALQKSKQLWMFCLHAPGSQKLAEMLHKGCVPPRRNADHPFSPFRLQIQSERAALEMVGEITVWPFYSLL